MIFTTRKSDNWGIFASTICIIHCFFTPLIFIVQTGSASAMEVVPTWWESIDYFLLAFSFIAVYYSSQNSSSQWVKSLFWITWIGLFILIINEKLSWLELIDGLVYLPAITLAVLHIYNQKHCQCKTDNCCRNDE